MGKKVNRSYADRINRVIDYINSHLSDDLSVDNLSQVANFSRFHFHRQFSEYAGISVYKLVQFMRLKRAAYQLVFNPSYRILDIALDAGYENPESFSRAFKKAYGQTPSRFRKKPASKPWLEKNQFKNRGARQSMKVNIVEFNETKVAALEHYGPDELIQDTVEKFIEWRKENGVSPRTSKTFNILYVDYDKIEPVLTRRDICAVVDEDVDENNQGVVTGTIPGGRCAVLRHIGSRENLSDGWHYLYAEWLPDSGEELRDFPPFFELVSLLGEVPDNELITDLYLPLK